MTMYCIDERFIKNYMLKEKNKKYTWDAAEYIKTGYAEIDKHCGGLRRGDTYLIVGRPDMGKQSFALNIWNNLIASFEDYYRIAYISMEQRKEQCLKQLAMIRGAGTQEWYREALDYIGNGFSFIDDSPEMDMNDIYRSCKSIEGPIDLIILDYLQLIKRGNGGESGYEGILTDAKRLAMEFDCPVIILAELSNWCESRINHRPTLQDVNITVSASAADHIWSVYRDDYYYKDSDRKGIAEIMILKPMTFIRTFQLVWIPDYCRFAELEKGYEYEQN